MHEDVASSTTRASEDRWREWALVTLGGNEMRATAAARAAVAAQQSGASGDALFAAAKAAYDGAGTHRESDRLVGADLAAPAARTAPPLRPSGGRALALTLAVGVAAGMAAVLRRYGTDGFLPVAVAAVVATLVWYLACRRAYVRLDGGKVTVQGLILRRSFDQLGVRKVLVQPSNPWWQLRAGTMSRQFIAVFVGEDGSTLFELRQGAWTRRDIDRIGAAIGVRVADEDVLNQD